jgi:hypothetical protein
VNNNSYYPNSKYSEKLPRDRELMHSYCVKISDFYHVLTIQEYSGHNRKLSVFKQQHINLQAEHGKGYNWHFIELKDSKYDY